MPRLSRDAAEIELQHAQRKHREKDLAVGNAQGVLKAALEDLRVAQTNLERAESDLKDAEEFERAISPQDAAEMDRAVRQQVFGYSRRIG